MARPISSDRILINRDGVDYQTSYGDVHPSICDLPTIPGPPVIALNGQPQTAPAELDDHIVIIRNGEGSGSPTNQWQRGLDGLWNDVAGVTGADYTVTSADEGVNIRLKQTFSNRSELYSNEIIGAKIPLPWETKDSWVHYKLNGSCYCNKHTGIYRLDGTLIADATDRYTYLSDEPEFILTGNEAYVEAMWSSCHVGPLSNLGTRTDMSRMFVEMDWLDVFDPGPDWDTTNVTNMANCFPYNGGAFAGDLSNWNTSNVTNMAGMFMRWNSYDCRMTGVSSWDTSNVTNMDSMFYNLGIDEDLSNWCVTKIPSRPDRFSSLPPEKEPQWGTCPRGEDQA